MKHPHDPKLVRVELDSPIQVAAKPQTLLVYDPIGNVTKERVIVGWMVRLIDGSNPAHAHIVNKVLIAPNLWAVVAGIDEEDEFWLASMKEKPDAVDAPTS